MKSCNQIFMMHFRFYKVFLIGENKNIVLVDFD